MAAAAQRAVTVLQVGAVAALVAFAAHTVLPDSARVSWFFDYPVYYGIVVTATVLVWLRAALVPLHRAGWVAMAIAVTSYAAAELVWLVAYADMESPPYPSWADLLYLGFFPASYVGVVLLFRARVRGVGPGLWIDGSTAALTAGALGSALLVDAVLDTTDGPPAIVATNLAYPLGDVFLLALVVGAVALTGWRPGRAWLLIGAALAVFALGDSVYLFQTAQGTYVEGRLLDVTWPAALLLIALAGWSDRARHRTVEATGRALLAVPATCAAVAVGILLLDHFHRVNLLALALATVALMGVVARLRLTFRENARLLAQTSRDAVTDPITGLGNRRRLVTDLDEAVGVASPAEPWLLAIFDLDGFKLYNDAFGHPAGDQLLARRGGQLAAVADEGVLPYRLGGDEFCLLAPVAGVDVERLVDRAARALAETGEGFAVTSSFGAVILPEEAHEPSEALRLADLRLYAQKHEKRAHREQAHRPLLQALLEREPGLHAHTEDVASLALAIGRDLGLAEGELDDLQRAALLHDIGKLAIPDTILHNPGPLSTEEWAFVQRHTLIGERILAVSPILRAVGRIVRSSHERWDGGGYPDGLAGEEIPLAARVIAVCDAWDAMTTDRPYRAALSRDEARRELERCAGTQFDPAVVAALVARVRGSVPTP
jgi:diguanylate cyclase (GGDEF)-like protein